MSKKATFSPCYHVQSKDYVREDSFLHCLTLVLLFYTCSNICHKSVCVIDCYCDSYCMSRLQTSSGLLSTAWLKISLISFNRNLSSVICSCTDGAVSFQADAPPLWLLRCCHGNRGSGHQSVSSILSVYFWVTGRD